MSAVSVLRRAGNKLYERAFPVYRPLYAAYKAHADRAERKLLRQILFPGAVVVDAGANIGIYSQFLSAVLARPGLSIHSSLRPKISERLRSATQRLSNVRSSQAAVGEHSGNSRALSFGQIKR